MERQIFLIRVNPKDWLWEGKPRNWDDLKLGGDISFDGNCKNRTDINKIRLHNIFVGYNMDNPNKPPKRNKCIVCLGRIVSDGCFNSVGYKENNNKRFLVQKTINLKNPLFIEGLTPLKPYQPTVVKLSIDDWDIIKKKILVKEPKHKEMIEHLENSWTDIKLPD